jgi:hypothetical protein
MIKLCKRGTVFTVLTENNNDENTQPHEKEL